MWSEMAVRYREEVRVHFSFVQRAGDLTQLQLVQLLIRKCQEYERVSDASKFSWGPSAFPRVEVEGS